MCVAWVRDDGDSTFMKHFSRVGFPEHSEMSMSFQLSSWSCFLAGLEHHSGQWNTVNKNAGNLTLIGV